MNRYQRIVLQVAATLAFIIVSELAITRQLRFARRILARPGQRLHPPAPRQAPRLRGRYVARRGRLAAPGPPMGHACIRDYLCIRRQAQKTRA
jgi:hypothetical protein